MLLFVSWTGSDFLRSLDVKVHWLQGHVFAQSTRLTYASQRKLYLRFCNLAAIMPVPLSQDNACRYIAFLSERLSYNSIKQYINVVRILHVEAGHVNPFLTCWQIDTLLKGTKRVLGVSIKQKLPITVDILRRMFTLVDLSCPLDVTFWASCLVAFFSFFRKSNLLVKGMESFDHSIHLCRRDAFFLQMELLYLFVGRRQSSIGNALCTFHCHVSGTPLCALRML